MRIALVIFSLGIAAEASAEEAARILHRPENDVRSGRAALHFRVDHPERAGAILVRWRPGEGEGATGEVRARRAVGGWVAELPKGAVRPPGFAYWAVERAADGSEHAIFASAADPHPVQVFDEPAQAMLRERLDGIRGRRSEMLASGEWIDFGSRRIPAFDGAVPDRYYRLEASYSYALLTAVDRIHITVGHLRGEAAVLDSPDAGLDVGTDYGLAAITWFVVPLLRFRTSLLFGISQEGFEAGGGASAIIGVPWRTSFTMSFEGVTTLGYTGGVRLGWATVPRVPMGASIEVTDFPSAEDAGVRLLYDIGFDLSDAWTVRAEGGYQGRTSVTGGPSAALELALRF